MKSTVEVVDYKKAVMRFRDLPKHLIGDLVDELYDNANEMRSRLVHAMTVTPKAPWFYFRQKGKKKHHPSLPGFPPARDAGELVRSLVAEARETEVEVGANAGAPYYEYLEKGTENMKARPSLEPMLEVMKPEIENNVLEAIKRSTKDHLK